MKVKDIIAIFGLAVLATAFIFNNQTLFRESLFASSLVTPNELSFQTLSLAGMVSLNFDDGFASAYQNGWPIIKASGLPSTHYIITNYLDHFDYLTSAEVLELEQAGAEIGAHTRTHPNLANLDQYDLPWQIEGSREALLNLGVKKVETFAYPYGSHNELSVEEVKKAGFVGARAFNLGLNGKTSDKYLLTRWGVSEYNSWPEIKDQIDLAMREKKWLILVFHRIDEDGNSISIRHEKLQQIVDYLKEKKILVVTTAEGIRLLHPSDFLIGPKATSTNPGHTR